VRGTSHNLNRLLDKPGSEVSLYENIFLNFTVLQAPSLNSRVPRYHCDNVSAEFVDKQPYPGRSFLSACGNRTSGHRRCGGVYITDSPASTSGGTRLGRNTGIRVRTIFISPPQQRQVSGGLFRNHAVERAGSSLSR